MTGSIPEDAYSAITVCSHSGRKVMTLEKNEFGQIVGDLSGSIADWTLENLLNVMKLAFAASNSGLGPVFNLDGYHANIDGFNAVYAFATQDDKLQAAALFEDGKMRVKTFAPNEWDIKVTFKTVDAFWKFIFSGGQDILDSLLANDVEVYGNVNYLYKFGFMARDLKERLALK
jgi:hypothetical protein